MVRIPNYELAQSKAYDALTLIKDDLFPISPQKLIDTIPDLKLSTYSEYAKYCGCDVSKVISFFGSEDGTIWNRKKSQNTNIIFYNDTISYGPMIRFTIAHELGHYFLKHSFQLAHSQIGVDDDEYNAMEKEANYFAKRFLAPLPIIYRIMDELPEPTISNDEIQAVFQVSSPTSIYIIDNMNNLPWTPLDDSMCSHFSRGIKEAEHLITNYRNLRNTSIL